MSDPPARAVPPSGWRALHWLTLVAALMAAAIWFLPTHLFGSGGYAGYGQAFLLFGVLAVGGLVALGGLVLTAVALRRDVSLASIWPGLLLDLLILGALGAVAVALL